MKKIKQFFCRHEFVIPKKDDDEVDRVKLIFDLKNGESISFSRLHICKKCGKEQMMGSGTCY